MRAGAGPALRWWVCGLLFAASAISYIDRQTLSIVAPMLTKEFGLNNEQLGRILAAFLLAYTFGQLLAGRFFDRVGSRVAFAVSMGVWSLANTLTALAGGFWGLTCCRFLLGAGESGNFPGGVKVVTEWFAPEERAFAGGLFTSGASIGGVLAGPLVGGIAHRWGWRPAFVVTGALGFIWIAAWWCLYWSARRQGIVTERDSAAPLGNEPGAAGQTMRWSGLLRLRRVWALTLARFLEEMAFWVWIFWLPKYVVDVRGFSILDTGWLLTVPFLALDVGYVSGGLISEPSSGPARLVRRAFENRPS